MAIRIWQVTHDGDVEVDLPVKFKLCRTCEGRGTHVNPAIDGNGLTAEDMDEAGPEFMEDYLGGVYDVQCYACHGKRVVEVVDEARCDKESLREYARQQRDLAQCRAEEAAERRAGA